jgi:hypothetical protein
MLGRRTASRTTLRARKASSMSASAPMTRRTGPTIRGKLDDDDDGDEMMMMLMILMRRRRRGMRMMMMVMVMR